MRGLCLAKRSDKYLPKGGSQVNHTGKDIEKSKGS